MIECVAAVMLSLMAPAPFPKAPSFRAGTYRGHWAIEAADSRFDSNGELSVTFLSNITTWGGKKLTGSWQYLPLDRTLIGRLGKYNFELQQTYFGDWLGYYWEADVVPINKLRMVCEFK